MGGNDIGWQVGQHWAPVPLVIISEAAAPATFRVLTGARFLNPVRATGINIRQIVETAAQCAAGEQLAAVIDQVLTREREIAACNDFSGMGFGDDSLEFRALQIDVLRPGRDVGARKALVVVLNRLIKCFAACVSLCGPVINGLDSLVIAGLCQVVIRQALLVRIFLREPGLVFRTLLISGVGRCGWREERRWCWCVTGWRWCFIRRGESEVSPGRIVTQIQCASQGRAGLLSGAFFTGFFAHARQRCLSQNAVSDLRRVGFPSIASGATPALPAEI